MSTSIPEKEEVYPPSFPLRVFGMALPFISLELTEARLRARLNITKQSIINHPATCLSKCKATRPIPAMARPCIIDPAIHIYLRIGFVLT